jgi:hypothetical protein
MTTFARIDAYRTRLSAGDHLAAQSRWHAAYREYCAAHDLGHDVRTDHLAAHRAALVAAVQMRSPARIAYQAVFLSFAFLTA